MSGIGSAVEVCVDFASCGDETFGDGDRELGGLKLQKGVCWSLRRAEIAGLFMARSYIFCLISSHCGEHPFFGCGGPYYLCLFIFRAIHLIIPI